MSLRKAIRFLTTICGIHFCFLGRNYETAYLNTTDEWTQVFIKWKWPSNRFWGHCPLNGEYVAGFTECSWHGNETGIPSIERLIAVTIWMKTSTCQKHTTEWCKQVQEFMKRYVEASSTLCLRPGSLRKKKSNQRQISLRPTELPSFWVLLL